MPLDQEEGKRRALNFVTWLTNQKEPIPFPTATTTGANAGFITEEAAIKAMTLLLDEQLLTMTSNLQQRQFIIVTESLGRHLPETLLNELATICAPTEGETNSRPRGAPPGNSNAMKHGKYSMALHNLGDYIPSVDTSTDLEQEIAQLRGLIKTLFNSSDTPIELLLKAFVTLTRIALAKHAIDLHPLPTDPTEEEEGNQWELPATDPDAPAESPDDS